LTVEEASHLRGSGYNPLSYYYRNPELKAVIDMIGNGYFSPQQPQLFMPLVDNLLHHGDQYLLLADFASYANCQERVSQAYCNQEAWVKKSIVNVANMGKFSSDRTIQEYAREIWGVSPVPVKL